MRADDGRSERWVVRLSVRLLTGFIVWLAACAHEDIRSLPVIDSHVHLAYWSVADQLAAHGVEAVVDLAAPTVIADSSIRVISSGPMLTHPNGYPLDAWGSDGYGIGCADAAAVTAAVDKLAASGAQIIKLAGDEDGLDPSLYPAAVSAAHAHGLKVAIHALSDASATSAAAAGVDILAHTPTEHVSNPAAWTGRAVISTLAAFGGSQTAIDNLRALRAAGVTVLYGTDLGNTRELVSSTEISLLKKAGMTDAEITDAMTTTPAAYWHLAFPADTYLVLDRDPRTDATALAHPTSVYVHGKLASCAGC